MQTNTESNRSTTVVERKTISIMKACELVGVSRRTIYNWIAGGKVEYVRTAGGSVRIFVDTLRSEEHTSELQSQSNLVCRLLLEKKNNLQSIINNIICHLL